MDGIILIQKLASVPPVMGMLTQMVTQRRDATIPRFNAICAGLGLVMTLADAMGLKGPFLSVLADTLWRLALNTHGDQHEINQSLLR